MDIPEICVKCVKIIILMIETARIFHYNGYNRTNGGKKNEICDFSKSW